MGPGRREGVLGIGRPATGILIWFLAIAVILAWALARALTRLHDRDAEQAITDPLTGLWNRRYMAETLDREVSRALRFGHPISLIILDVDEFKAINDRHGHLQGDLVLEAVADVVRDATRSIDVAARYGGDELALILAETDPDGAAVLAERVREAARDTEIPLRESAGAMSVTLSVGVATIPDSADDLESLVDSADRALLRAKKAGKNQIRTVPAKRTPRPGTSRRRTRATGGRGRTAKHSNPRKLVAPVQGSSGRRAITSEPHRLSFPRSSRQLEHHGHTRRRDSRTPRSEAQARRPRLRDSGDRG